MPAKIYLHKGAKQEYPYNAEFSFIELLPEENFYREEQPLNLNRKVLSA
jgi:hypothetical protein